MTCEYVVRVRDDDDRLLHNDSRLAVSDVADAVPARGDAVITN